MYMSIASGDNHFAIGQIVYTQSTVRNIKVIYKMHKSSPTNKIT